MNKTYSAQQSADRRQLSLATWGLLSLYIDAMTEHELIAEIDRYCAAVGIAPATLCGRAVGNSRLYGNLMANKSCTLTIAAKLVEYIADHPAPANDEPDTERAG